MKRQSAIFLSFLCVALIASVFYFNIFHTTKESITLARKDIIGELAGEGVVSAASEVNSGFIIGGRVAEVYVQKGDIIKKDEVLARLDSAEKEAELAQYEAKIEVAKLRLSQLLSGAGESEIALAESKITATVSTLEYARKELEDAKMQAENGIAKHYALAVDHSNAVLLNAENATNALSGIYTEQNKFKDIFIISDSQKKAEAEWQVMLEKTALENIAHAGRAMQQGVASDVIDATLSNFKTNLEVIRAALQKTSEILDDATMAFGAPEISGYRTTVAVQRSVINTTQTEILKLEQEIESQKVSGSAWVRGAENAVAEAENTLRTLEHELAVKKAFITNTAIALEQAQIKEYELHRKTIQQQMADSVLRAPFDSMVRRVAVRRGSIVLRDTTAVVLAPLSELQADITVAEGDEKTIAIGDAVDVAWGEEKTAGSVANIQANTITVHFENEGSAPALGARVTARIYTVIKKDALFAPERFIEESEGVSYVYAKGAEGKKKIAVITGMKRQSEVEIVEGVSAGDVLVMP